MGIFLETIIYLIAVFGIIMATYFCFVDKTQDFGRKIISNYIENNTKKKVEFYLYNIKKEEEKKLIDIFNKDIKENIDNVDINVFKIIDKK